MLLEDPPSYEGDDARRNASPIAARFPEFVALVESLQARSAPVDEVAEMLGAAPSLFGGTAVERFGAAAMRLPAAAVLQCHPNNIRAAIDGSTWHGFDPDTPLPVPTTVVRGEQRYGSVLPEDLAARFMAVNPHAEVVAVPGVGHSIHTDPHGREAFLAVLARFAAGVRLLTNDDVAGCACRRSRTATWLARPTPPRTAQRLAGRVVDPAWIEWYAALADRLATRHVPGRDRRAPA